MASLISLSQPRAMAQFREQKQQRRTKLRRAPSSPLTLTTTTKRPLPLRVASFPPPASLKKEEDEEEKESVSSSSFPAPLPLVPVLSRSAERTIGRTAMLGFACAVAGEVLAGGGGPLSQLHLLHNNETGLLPSFLLDALLAGSCASVFLFSLSPVSRTWNDAAVREALLRPPSPFSTSKKKPSADAKAAMVEVLAGRLALLGCLILLLVERQTGGLGALEQLGLFARVADGGDPLKTSSLVGARVLLLWIAFVAVAWVTRFSSSLKNNDKRR